MLTFDATEQINEVSRTRTRTTTQVITRCFGRWPQTKTAYPFSLLNIKLACVSLQLCGLLMVSNECNHELMNN